LCSPLDDGRAVTEPGAEKNIRVREESFLERDNDELRSFEPRPEQLPDMLGMRKVQCRIDLVKNVHRRWLEL
jgi:hypothetical protein